jgi:Domain of unknown function (DUF6429)
MTPDTARIDDAILGLLYLTLHQHDRVCKSMDWDGMGRLFEKGLITDPTSTATSVQLTASGLREAQRCCDALFATPRASSAFVVYGGARTEARSADGVRGVLCRDAITGRGFFRVYDKNGGFCDYELRHDELSVTIDANAMAAFYDDGIRSVLDHSTTVLGLTPA